MPSNTHDSARDLTSVQSARGSLVSRSTEAQTSGETHTPGMFDAESGVFRSGTSASAAVPLVSRGDASSVGNAAENHGHHVDSTRNANAEQSPAAVDSWHADGRLRAAVGLEEMANPATFQTAFGDALEDILRSER